jgi:patatin-like phospholipase/acyl hydrolase
VLADLEVALGTGNSIVGHFDLVAGTSTGGILALGLGAGKSAREIRDLYMHRGPEIFPPVWDNVIGRAWKAFRNNVLNATLRAARPETDPHFVTGRDVFNCEFPA